MSVLVNRLLFLLVVQGIICAVVFWPQEPERTQHAVPLTSLTTAAITQITIEDSEQNSAVVKKVGSAWVLPELGGLPADPAMIDRVLAMATANASHWPVASSAGARQRFQVEAYLFQRRLQLQTGDGSQTTLFLGTSPGFRKVHVRNSRSDDIYAESFNVFDAPAHSAQWLDPALLQARAVTGIVADSYSIRFDGSQWRSGAGGVPDKRELEALLGTLRNLQIAGIADTSQVALLEAAEPELELSIQSLAGESGLALFQLESAYFVRSSRYPYFFGSNAYDFDRLTGIDFGLITGTP